MNPETTLLSIAPYLDALDLVGWLGWFAFLFASIAWIAHIQRGQILHKQHAPKILSTNWRQVSFLILLLALIPFATLFAILRLSPENLPPAPGHMVDPQGPALVVFAALPLSIAAGFFGVIPSAVIGAITGAFLAGWATHNPFTILEFALIAIALNVASHQPYRTRFYRALRRPLLAAVLVALLYPVLSILTISLSTFGNAATRLDYALTLVPYISLVVAGELILAGLFTEILAWASPASWGNRAPLKPSPIESRLRTRFLYGMAPLAILLIAILMVGDWVVAGKAAERLLEQRMASIAQASAETIPFFVESGQNLIQRLAQDIDWFALSPDERQVELQQSLRTVPYFQQLYLLDNHGEEVASLPQAPYRQNPMTPPEELAGVDLALHGVPIQSYTIPPISGEQQAQVSFLSTITAADGTIQGVLIGRSELVTNPFIQPVLSSLQTLRATGGEGMLIDGNGNILFHTDYTGLLSPYTGLQTDHTLFYKGKAPDGTGRLYYYQPALGHPWAIVLSVPARQAQQLAVDIAAPLLIMIVMLFTAAAIILRLSLRSLTGSLQSLALEADRISSGQLDNPLLVEGDDEVGQLRRSFERMRISLKARLDELNRLLVVSQGVAASLEMESAVQPVLEAALSNGACVARVVLSPSAIPEIEGDSPYPTSYGLGPYNEIFSSLDEQILTLTRQQERVIITNPTRVRLLNFVSGAPRPEALLAVALRHENTFYGVLWLGFDQPHTFTEDEIRFITTLAGQTALAATNARLFLNAEVGRQRLAGILDSTPDPVLVTDHQNRLLLANPAAWFALDLGIDTSKGLPIEKVIPNLDLARLMRSNADEKQSAEIILPDDRVYLAMASQVMVGNRRVGRVCVLRDVTRFKELDSLKSEFVATVSHDLRSPLTLIRGYTTMLEMVGDLNDQQNSYVRKIISGVETMSRLVNNLLDLGRIEAGIDLQLEMIPIHEIIERVVTSMQLQASQKHIQLSITPPETMPVVEADQALLQQAMHNLVENALKYTENGGKVTLSSYVQDDKLILEIRDTGIGIAPVDQPRLFEKFYRGAQRNARKQQGSGLGLAIVKSIAERHGGRVWLESQLGKGSTFFFAIPLRQEQRERLKTP